MSLKDYDLDDFEDFDELEDSFNETKKDNTEEIDLDEYEPDDSIEEIKEESNTISDDKFDDEYLDEDEEDNQDEDDKEDSEEVEEDDSEDPKSNKSKIGIIVCSIIITMSLITLFILKGCSNKTFTIKFDSAGGTPVSEQKVKKNGKVKLPSEPSKDGYDFVGWYVGSTRYDFDSKVNRNLVITAHWDSKNAAAIEGVTLDQTSITLSPGGKAKLVATLKPDNSKSTDFTWTSSNPNVVEVDTEGNITAIKEGTALITVTTDEGGFTSTCAVTVSRDKVDVTGISLNKTDVTMGVNDTELLVAVITPEDATNKGVLWSSSDDSIVSVVEGKLTAKKGGNVTITAETKDGGLKTTARVIVKDIPVTDIKINNARNMYVGEKLELKTTINPVNASNKEITWSSNNTSVATVDSKGIVTAINVGNVTISATTSNNKKYSVNISVSKKDILNSIAITGCKNITVGQTLQLGITKNPANASIGEVNWTSSRGGLTVNKGQVSATAAGTYTVTASVNGFSDSCTIKVEEQDNYKVIVKPDLDATSYSAKYSVTKNGSAFTGFSHIIINGNEYRDTITDSVSSGSSATIVLNDGNRVSATIVVE